jgi:glutamate formiminotransferase
MLIECVPNVSEGRRGELIARLAGAVRAASGVRLLDVSADEAHHRSVFTLAGDASTLPPAVTALFDAAIAEIDLRRHSGEHPRIGAVDVVPFVPLAGAQMDDCVALARRVAADVADRFALPIYLYGEAASRPERRNLEEIRRGGLDGLASRMELPEWTPDFGPRRLHPTAGASAIGARDVLIAYNINLATDRLDVAKKIARAVRTSGGGLPHVKAIGLRLEGRRIVQVSMNVMNYAATPLDRVFDAVRTEAEPLGVSVLESEIVGLAPAAALPGDIARHIRLSEPLESKILERKLNLAI